MRKGIAVTKSPKYVYLFEEADGTNKKLLGGKGAGLAEMTHMGLPVPPGFIVSIEACVQYYQNKKRLPKGLMEEVQTSLKKVEEKTGEGIRKFTESLILLCPIRGSHFHAWHDGHHPQSGFEQRDY